MIGLILVAHGNLAQEFVRAMEHVVGPQEAVAAICIGPNDDMEQRRKDIADAIKQVDSGSGVIILSDLFGGTPSNLAISLMEEGKIEVIAGVNLPMLIRIAGLRSKRNVTETVSAASEAGRNYISVASQLLCGAKKTSNGRAAGTSANRAAEGSAEGSAEGPAGGSANRAN